MPAEPTQERHRAALPHDLDVTAEPEGRFVVTDRKAGHRLVFRLATSARGAQELDALRPEWAGGTEPVNAPGYMLAARQLAETEARDRGMITAHDPDVG